MPNEANQLGVSGQPVLSVSAPPDEPTQQLPAQQQSTEQPPPKEQASAPQDKQAQQPGPKAKDGDPDFDALALPLPQGSAEEDMYKTASTASSPATVSMAPYTKDFAM